jgi:hypothetical protein
VTMGSDVVGNRIVGVLGHDERRLGEQTASACEGPQGPFNGGAIVACEHSLFLV